jgi:transglutaminase-like putative cysteine protease
MSAWLLREMRFDVDATTAETEAASAFENRHGVCQDFAHVMIAAARTLGLPARYVSGYILRTDSEHQEAGHAWVEVRLPAFGWVAFDPAHGLSPDDRYVRVAIGCDAREAAPVRGARIGGVGEKLEVTLQVMQSRAAGQN